MTPLSHNAHELTLWLRKRYPEVLEEYKLERDTKWEKKVQGPFKEKSITERNTITRTSYLKPNDQVYKFEEFKSPPPKKVQPSPTNDDYGNLIYLAEEMGLDEEIVQNMKKAKKKVSL